MKSEPEHIRRAREAARKKKATDNGPHNPDSAGSPADPFAEVSDEVFTEAPQSDGLPGEELEAQAEPGGKGKKESIATLFVKLAQAGGIELFHTPNQTPHAPARRIDPALASLREHELRIGLPLDRCLPCRLPASRPPFPCTLSARRARKRQEHSRPNGAFPDRP